MKQIRVYFLTVLITYHQEDSLITSFNKCGTYNIWMQTNSVVWLYVLVMSRTRSRVNPHFIVVLYGCQGTPCLKQVQNLNFKWLQQDSNSEPLSSQTNTQPFGQTGQTIELCSEYLSAWCIWLYVLVMSHMRFRVNPHSIFGWMSRNYSCR